MSLLSAALTKTLSDLHWSQKRLSQLTGVPAPQINRYVRGASTIQIDTLGKILAVLPDDQRPDLLAAFLRDQTPPGFADLVTVAVNTSQIREEESDLALPAGMDRELKKTVHFLAKLAMTHREIRDMLENFERLMRPK